MKNNMIFDYLLILFKKNPVKTIILLLLPVFIITINSIDPVKIKKINYTEHVDADNGYNYFLPVESYDFKKINEKNIVELGENFVRFKDTKEVYIILWTLLIIFCLILLVGTFNTDEDVNWEFKDTLRDCIRKRIVCKVEYNSGGEVFYYIVNDRLLLRSEVKLSIYDYNLSQTIKEYIKYKKNFPIFKLKMERRNDLLEDLIK